EEAGDIPATFSAIESGRADATMGTEMTIKRAYESGDSENLELVEDFEQPDSTGVPSYGASACNEEDDGLREACNDKLEEFQDIDEYEEMLADNYFDDEDNMPDDDLTADMVCSEEVYVDR